MKVNLNFLRCWFRRIYCRVMEFKLNELRLYLWKGSINYFWSQILKVINVLGLTFWVNSLQNAWRLVNMFCFGLECYAVAMCEWPACVCWDWAAAGWIIRRVGFLVFSFAVINEDTCHCVCAPTFFTLQPSQNQHQAFLPRPPLPTTTLYSWHCRHNDRVLGCVQ